MPVCVYMLWSTINYALHSQGTQKKTQFILIKNVKVTHNRVCLNIYMPNLF